MHYNFSFPIINLKRAVYIIFTVILLDQISKIFEETIRGTVSECLSHFENNEPKGEFVICIEGLKS